jgi:probable F420-dependent oxidoreductase
MAPGLDGLGRRSRGFGLLDRAGAIRPVGQEEAHGCEEGSGDPGRPEDRTGEDDDVITFALQAVPENAGEWLETARKAEANGFDTLVGPDHPGAFAAPHVALAAAAAVTTTIGLGARVLNAGVHEPMQLATEVATLDVVSGGRAMLGIGAGHNATEWAAIGRTRPDVRGRVDRCIAAAEATRRLLAGEAVTVDSPELRMTAARLESPRPVRAKVPLHLGGGNPRLLQWAAEQADVIALPWMGRSWTLDQIDERLAPLRGKVLETQPHRFEVTNDPGTVLREMSDETGLGVHELRQMPHVLVGSIEEIAAAIREHERRWGITRYALYKPALDHLPALRAALEA